METLLKDIVEVIAGYTFRNAIKSSDNGDIYVVQAVNTYDGDDIDLKYLPKIITKGTRSNAILKQNDIVLSCRGNFRASVYVGDSNISIASSSLYILRIKDKKILPHFLSIYLNSKLGQRAINKMTTGAVIKTILRRDIENLSIIIPSLSKQQQAIDIFSNCKKQSKIHLKQIKVTLNIAEGVINHILTNPK